MIEIRAKCWRMVWLGEDECRVVLMQWKRSEVLLRKSGLKRGSVSGSMRANAVVFGGKRIVAAY